MEYGSISVRIGMDPRFLLESGSADDCGSCYGTWYMVLVGLLRSGLVCA